MSVEGVFMGCNLKAVDIDYITDLSHTGVMSNIHKCLGEGHSWWSRELNQQPFSPKAASLTLKLPNIDIDIFEFDDKDKDFIVSAMS